ncbi:allantoicase [Corynebacterium falsenii DSM 44353]|uniref:allantoicase n=1 Tax=Corynebacterium falsenii TaxID=108486 RepID=UPI0003E958A9|nr:allantoicase [Corynebacterium falsenii]AHI02295.1 allantoicase [Corynebacterium falsenii DSM 44353]MDC7104861.1 allantoicase [Corynebacterium falsenii]UBI05062.1 allantoicase [Corynebacterium falsenii]
MSTPQDFENYPDLANRQLAGSVIWASDESFAERENLIMPHDPAFDPALFGNKGKVYDGWETRRRRHEEIGHNDAAIVRLGVPGHIRGVVVDTSWFTGNYPPQFAVKGICIDDYLPADEIAALPDSEWFDLVGVTDAQGDTRHAVAIDPDSAAGQTRVTHVKLIMIPDGGIARLRVHGIPAPNPQFLGSTVDLAAIEHGGWVTECSNMFYSSPNQILSLGRAINMGGGWENARRRNGGNDHVVIRLAGESVPEFVEVDTSYFVFNAPGEIRLTGWNAGGDVDADGSAGVDADGSDGGASSAGVDADGSDGSAGSNAGPEIIELVSKRRVLPDTRHRFAVSEEARDLPITHVRLDVYPDGGLARLRVFGSLTGAGLRELEARWER